MSDESTMDFRRDVLERVRRHLRHRVSIPAGPTWSAVDRGPEGVEISVSMEAAGFGANLQGNVPASPLFALSIAWWYQLAADRPTSVSVRIVGEPPMSGNALLHSRRAQFLLSEIERALKPRFAVSPTPAWAWPSEVVINAPRGKRRDEHKRRADSEHALEVQIATSPALLESFPAALARIDRQLPLGLFDGQVSKATCWTPGKASQVDLWGMSSDGRSIHLIELKTKGNASVGILAEAIYYARVILT